MMNKAFHFALWNYVLVFLDDILIYSVTWESHLQDLEIVLSTLQQEHLFAKFFKCSFGVQPIDYLGYIVSAEDV